MAIFPMLAKYTMHATCNILVKKVSHGGATTKTFNNSIFTNHLKSQLPEEEFKEYEEKWN